MAFDAAIVGGQRRGHKNGLPGRFPRTDTMKATAVPAARAFVH
ncbi:MAG: hypothetical protein V4795_05465 [Pseudomonadota bacterium]